MTEEEKRKLEDVVEEACKKAHRLRYVAFKESVVNWGYLHCVEVVTKPVVVIEEADSFNPQLKNFIRDYLKEHGYDVEVLLEW